MRGQKLKWSCAVRNGVYFISVEQIGRSYEERTHVACCRLDVVSFKRKATATKRAIILEAIEHLYYYYIQYWGRP